MLETFTKRLKGDKRGVSNVIVVMLSLILIVVIAANVILWSYQMNQLDWEKMQEKIEIADVERITRSSWFTSENEYTVNIGSHTNGTYMDTWTVNNAYETFSEELAPLCSNPSGYILGESTKHISGNIIDLATNNGAYMVFRSYSSAFSPQTLCAHRESATIAGASYYQLKLNTADSSGITLDADASTTGRKLLTKFVYQLTGVTTIPASTWTFYYRAYKTGPLTVAHCDVDILIRKADGTIRTIIATDIANSTNLTTSWSTVLATYLWSDYVVEDETDFLEVDYHAHVTTSQANRRVYLGVDDSSLSINEQTRIVGVMLPSEYRVEVELIGTSDTQDWQSLTWTVDSSFTTGDVNVTLQLYNYNTSQYPTSGDGHISYISSSTPNTDETQNQTITVNPAHFRGSTGEWKIKMVGIKETTSQFDLKVDWVEFKVMSQGTYRLDVSGEFLLDLSTYPFAYINSIEIQIRYRVNDSLENWFLKTYNWTSGQYSDAGFNSTTGHSPTTEFESYAVNLTDAWQSYVQNNGTIKIKFCDENPDVDQSIVDIDFLGGRAIIDGARFSLRNNGAATTHIVSIWIVNSTYHKRYDANFFVNSGESATYIRADIRLPTENFVVKVVTERGNIAVFASP